jgi:hypothetical protein
MIGGMIRKGMEIMINMIKKKWKNLKKKKRRLKK